MNRRTYPCQRSPLFQLVSRKRLARNIFGCELSDIESLASTTGNYRVFKIKQREKGRQIEVPKPPLERVQRRLFGLLERIEKPDYLHSGVRGRCCMTNARAHAGAMAMVKLEIKQFYPSISSARVARFFMDTLACSPDVAAVLTRLSTYDERLPSGSCLSQLLAFFAAKPMLDELQALALGAGLRFTCYADELVWSGPGAAPDFLQQVKSVLHRYGFASLKEQCYGAGEQRLVSGVLLEGERLVELPSREFEFWSSTQALAGGDIEQRLAAANRLAGMAQAASQFEIRFVQKLQYLRRAQQGVAALAQPAPSV